MLRSTAIAIRSRDVVVSTLGFALAVALALASGPGCSAPLRTCSSSADCDAPESCVVDVAGARCALPAEKPAIAVVSAHAQRSVVEPVVIASASRRFTLKSVVAHRSPSASSTENTPNHEESP